MSFLFQVSQEYHKIIYITDTIYLELRGEYFLKLTDIAATDLIEEIVKTASVTYDPTKRNSEVLEEVFADEPEDAPTDTLYRKYDFVFNKHFHFFIVRLPYHRAIC